MFAASKTAAVSSAANYIEDVFSTYLYTGNAGTQTVTNGIDLAGDGGMVWIKSRSNAYAHSILDTVRGFNYSGTQTKRLDPSTTGSQADEAGNATQASPLSDGFSVTTSGGGAINFYNASGATYASWTFRKQAKFFDVVTYTGNGSARTIAHSLGSVPACMIIKDCTNAGSAWAVYHTSLGNTQYLQLQSTGAAATSSGYWNNTTPTSTEFTVGTNGNVNQSGATYIAYLFAHNAGGFGLTGTDNVISCGSFTTDGSGAASVNLGYEPQWVLIKYNSNDSWRIFDNMRGMSQTNWAELYPNTSDAEVNRTNQTNLFVRPNATGFTTTWSPQAGNTAIYIAIRRGPMKVPTSGTSVFTPVLRTTGNPNFVAGFPIDMSIYAYRPGATGTPLTISRLTNKILVTNETSAEVANDPSLNYDQQLGYGSGQSTNSNVLSWMWRRAPSFFDVVCYTGTGSATTFTHNLGVAPELVIVKWRSGATGEDWAVMCTAASSSPDRRFLYLDLNAAGGGLNGIFADSSGTPVLPTATQVYIGTNSVVNKSAATYVAYLFATCAGVSKVGSYTGTGATQTISCGFTGGARFVLIKRTDSTGDWFVWDTARGMVSGTDPRLPLNSTAAESNANWVYTTTGGFQIVTTDASVNASGGTYIYLAIA